MPDNPAIYCEAMMILVLSLLFAGQPAAAAIISGTVTDAQGRPVKDARIDHTGMLVVVPPAGLAVEPSAEDQRTDADGHFRITTAVPAIVIRKAGYISQRIRITGDADVSITLQPVKTETRCKQSPPPEVKTRKANDIDYVANWYYIDTKDGPKGILKGSGPSYSWGAPLDQEVWRSTEYSEMMSNDGVIDASGRSANGKYWRSRDVFGEAAHYFDLNQADAEQLDCVMDRIQLVKPR